MGSLHADCPTWRFFVGVAVGTIQFITDNERSLPLQALDVLGTSLSGQVFCCQRVCRFGGTTRPSSGVYSIRGIVVTRRNRRLGGADRIRVCQQRCPALALTRIFLTRDRIRFAGFGVAPIWAEVCWRPFIYAPLDNSASDHSRETSQRGVPTAWPEQQGFL